MIASKARTKTLFCVEEWSEVRSWNVTRTYVWAESSDDAMEILEEDKEPHVKDIKDSWSSGTEYEVFETLLTELPEDVVPYELNVAEEL